MSPRAAPFFDRADADLTRAFFIDVLAIPTRHCADGTTVLAYPPSRLGVCPRALSPSERAVLGPDGLGLTCADLPEMIAELSGYGFLLLWVGLTRSKPTATFQVTLRQCVTLIGS